MNTRTREKCRAILMQKQPNVFATLRKGNKTYVLFLTRKEIEQYKLQYGERFKVYE